MDVISRIAFDATKELLIAKMNSSSEAASQKNGEDLADMFEAVYTRLLKIAREAEVK